MRLRLLEEATHAREELRKGEESLEALFVELVGGVQKGELSWL